MAYETLTFSFQEVLTSAKMTKFFTDLTEVRAFHKGASEPAVLADGIVWLDDSTTPWVLKMYDGADWIDLAEINATTNAAAFEGGGITLISSQVASASASIDFTSGLDSTYDEYVVFFMGVRSASNGVSFYARCGAGSFDAAGGDYSALFYGGTLSGGTFATRGDGAEGVNQIDLLGLAAAQSATTDSLNGEFHIYKPASTAFFKRFAWRADATIDTGRPYQVNGDGIYEQAAAIDRVQFLMSSGNIAEGRFTLFGIRHQ